MSFIIMVIKGSEELLNHLPDYKGRILRCVIPRIPLIAIISFSVTVLIDSLPRILANRSSSTPVKEFFTFIEPIIPILTPTIPFFIGMHIVHQMWYQKNKFLKKNREKAYQNAFKFLYSGIPVIVGAAIHMYAPISYLPFKIGNLPDPLNPVTSFMSNSILNSLFDLMGIPMDDFWIRFVGSLLMFTFAVIFIVRTVSIFGIDYAAVLYNYYPEESEIIDHDIYSIIRNPLYFGFVLLGIAAFISRLSLYSLLFAIEFVVLFYIFHIRAVEDKELVERFGENFKMYQKKVPALIPHPKHWMKIITFTVNGKI